MSHNPDHIPATVLAVEGTHNDDVTQDDDLVISEDLFASPTHKSAGTSAIDFDGLLSPPLRLHEDLRNGNGGQAWPAGMVLASYLLRHRREELRRAKTIIELGAGSGLVGLAIASGIQSLQTEMHITDQEEMVPLMRRNISLNDFDAINDGHSRVRVLASTYSWGDPRPSHIPAADVILAADCVYFEPAFPLLLKTLGELLSRKATDENATPNEDGSKDATKPVCYFCFKRRRRADMHFLKSAKKAFVVEEVDDDEMRDGYKGENIFLLTIRSK